MMTIKECRKKSKYSVGVMADIMGVPESKYVKMENYQIPMNISDGVKISQITNTNINDIFFYNPD